MKMTLLSATTDADKLALVAARNDYFPGDISEKSFEQVMGKSAPEDLMRHLMMRGHWGPLEHAQFTVHFDCSRACMAQITRHRFISFDIQSMRYVKFDNPDFYYPSEHWDIEDGQARIKTRKGVKSFNKLSADCMFDVAYDKCVDVYKELVKMGVPEEDARNVLPIGTKVNVVASMNLRTAFHIISMRGAGDAQSEIRTLAQLLENIVEEVAPLAYATWKENRRAIERQRLSP